MLRLCNSLTRKKEKFVPLDGNKVKLYVCGITPYDTTHLGHAFTYVFFDVLYRFLKFKGFEVNYTQNVTDIDDDIIKKAREEGKKWNELGVFWTEKYLKEMKTLNVLPPTNFVKATDTIDEILKMIETLEKKGFAYKRGGNIYFDVKKFKRYGNLSKFNEVQMKLLLKERGGDPNDPLKKFSLDFLLWQSSNLDEPSWKSPWVMPDGRQGEGRPGWHIECSAMINKFLGEQVDIHGGGRDLIFPHHESEIAQSESFTGKKPFAKFFMHTSMVLYQGEKMSKSLGNLVMISDLLKKYKPNELRWYLLSHYYKKPWEFEEEELKQARNHLLNIKKVVKKAKNTKKVNQLYLKKFLGILDNDMCTPEALDFIFHIAEKPRISPTLLKCLSVLGIEI